MMRVEMKFASTRTPKTEVSFKEAVFSGLAPDGGLYHPVTVPDLGFILAGLKENSSMAEIGTALTAALFAPEISPEAAQRICRRAFTFEPALVPFDKNPV